MTIPGRDASSTSRRWPPAAVSHEDPEKMGYPGKLPAEPGACSEDGGDWLDRQRRRRGLAGMVGGVAAGPALSPAALQSPHPLSKYGQAQSVGDPVTVTTASGVWRSRYTSVLQAYWDLVQGCRGWVYEKCPERTMSRRLQTPSTARKSAMCARVPCSSTPTLSRVMGHNRSLAAAESTNIQPGPRWVATVVQPSGLGAATPSRPRA